VHGYCSRGQADEGGLRLRFRISRAARLSRGGFQWHETCQPQFENGKIL
jgi:hypothetical protein